MKTYFLFIQDFRQDFQVLLGLHRKLNQLNYHLHHIGVHCRLKMLPFASYWRTLPSEDDSW